MLYGEDKVVVEIKIPEDRMETLAIGPHLKGVANYLRKSCNGRYDQYVVGKRLFVYTEVAAPDMSDNRFSMDDLSLLYIYEHVDLQHLYIDGSKFEANANKYTWVWKKAADVEMLQIYMLIVKDSMIDLVKNVFNLILKYFIDEIS